MTLTAIDLGVAVDRVRWFLTFVALSQLAWNMLIVRRTACVWSERPRILLD
jgi:hypothetical protein